MRPLILLCLLFPLAVQANLYKCLDNDGHVTYTSSACSKAGLKETKIIPPPPPPAIDAPRVVQATPQAKPVVPKPAEVAKPAEMAKSVAQPETRIALSRVQGADSGSCAKLNEQMGKVMDEMDEARRAGYTAKQEADWSARLSHLQTEKGKASCF